MKSKVMKWRTYCNGINSPLKMLFCFGEKLQNNSRYYENIFGCENQNCMNIGEEETSEMSPPKCMAYCYKQD